MYSCGIYLTPKAIQIAKSYSEQNRIFNEVFDGYWGEEDRFLGDIMFKNNLSIGYTSKIKLSGTITESNEASDKIIRNFLVRLKLRQNILAKYL